VNAQREQTAGNQFEAICADFVRSTFLRLDHLRPGRWTVQQVKGRNRLEIARYEQYSHLVALDRAARTDPDLAAALGSDYTITPDVVIVREPEEDSVINSPGHLVNDNVATLTSLRRRNGGLPLLHASISCKWTIRSDRAQNARSEALESRAQPQGPPSPHPSVRHRRTHPDVGFAIRSPSAPATWTVSIILRSTNSRIP